MNARAGVISVISLIGCHAIFPYSSSGTDAARADRSADRSASAEQPRDGPRADFPGSCVINGIVYPTGTKDADPCHVCDPSIATSVWSPAEGCVTTLAGDGNPSLKDGPLLAARFNSPHGIAVDERGRVYVADEYNNRIRLIANEVVTTIAGGDVHGLKDGAVAQALFSEPHQPALHLDRIFIADPDNQAIRLIENGAVSTLAGGVKGFIDGAAAEARFDDPASIAVHYSGKKVYVADVNNQCIRLIENGQVSTFAGQCGSDGGSALGPASSTRFSTPRQVLADGDRVYVSDAYNLRIVVIENGYAKNLAVGVSWELPLGLALDAKGRLFVSEDLDSDYPDYEPVRAKLWVLSGGQRYLVAGKDAVGMADGPALQAQFTRISGLAYHNGVIYVADEGNNRIRLVRPKAQYP